MAGCGYTYRSGGYTTNNGVAPPTEGWRKTSYSSSDHVCRPVFIDADGRRKPIMSYTAPDGSIEYYVTTTEIVEVPNYVTEYKQCTPVRSVEVLSDYGDVEGKRNRHLSPEKWRHSSSPVRYHGGQEKWNRPSSPPVRFNAAEKWYRPSSPVRYNDAEKWNRPPSPVRYNGAEKWNRPPSPVRYNGAEKWNRPPSPVRYNAEEKRNRRPSSPVHERPQQVEDFITKIQTQASRPNKFGPLSATYWRQTPNSNTGYGDQSELISKKEWQKPSATYLEPPMTTTTNGGAWAAKPSHGAWSTGQGANLSQPTSDINTAMEYLKEAAKPPSGLKRDTYHDTIDSREAERKYGSLNVASRPVSNYTRTIDSREAARKYGGSAV